MSQVTVVSHPLVQHKLTKMRDKQTSSANFRRLLALDDPPERTALAFSIGGSGSMAPT